MLSEALRLIRVYHNLKQYELAERIEVSKSHVSEIEKGTKTPSLEVIIRYSKEFDIPVSSIMFFAEELPKAKRGDQVRRAIASKVINFLKFVERRSEPNAN